VTDAASIRKAAIRLEGVAIDLVINSAGIVGVSGQRAGNIDYASWAHVLDVNTMGPLRVLENFLDHIARSERRLVVTITSGMGSNRRQYVRRLDCLSHLQGCGEHGDAKRGDRSGAAPHHLRCRQSGLGQDRHGGPQRDADGARECNRPPAANRDAWPD